MSNKNLIFMDCCFSLSCTKVGGNTAPDFCATGGRCPPDPPGMSKSMLFFFIDY